MTLPWWLSWKRICLQCRRPWFDSWVGKIPWRRDRLPTLIFLVFPGDSDGEESTCNVGDLGSIPGLGRSPGEESEISPLPSSCLGNSTDRGAWRAAVHRAAKSQTQLSDFHFHFSPGDPLKNLPANAGDSRDAGSIHGSGRYPGEGNGNPLQYSCLGNAMNRGVWLSPKESDTTE